MGDVGSVLVLSDSPDLRTSTAELRWLVEDLRDRGVAVTTWFLRDGPDGGRWPDARIIDDLRMWAPAAWLDRVGLGSAAAHLRGLRLRSWWARTRPDAVIHDDGLGGHVVTADRGVVRVLRRNLEAPAPMVVGERALDDADLIVLEPGRSASAARPRELVAPPPRDLAEQLAGITTDRLADLRVVYQLPTSVPIVAVRGLDPAEIATQTVLAAVAQLVADGEDVHLLWFVDRLDRGAVSDLVERAAAAGLRDRIHIRRFTVPDALSVGDVLVMATSDLDVATSLRVAASGCTVLEVTDVVPGELPGAWAVPRADRLAAALAQADRGAWVTRFLAALAAAQ